MRKLIVHEFISLDGVIQAPGGKTEDTEGGFKHGGWTIPYWHDDIGKHFDTVMKQADTILLGRKTWQIHSVFEKMQDPFADAMNKLQKYVVSKSLKSADVWRKSSIIRDNVVGEVKKLKKKKGGNIISDGSSVLLHTLIAHGLVDEFHLHVYPVILGSGKRLFPKGKRINLRLVTSKALPTGVTFTKYAPAKENGKK